QQQKEEDLGKQEMPERKQDGEGGDQEQRPDEKGGTEEETDAGESDAAEQEKGKRGELPESEQKAGDGEETPDDALPGKDAGKEAETSGKQPMISKRQQGALLPPEEIPDTPAAGMEAVEQFEQLGESQDKQSDGQSEMTGDEGEGTAANAASLLMEQWLHQIEGNPAYLLRQQFGQEEQRLIRQQRGPVSEPRPW
ncbi:MAG: hypothetical protein KDI35_16440, partial [Gammaproteobacteria bacterium]|nr:hypothetical protein [Gammaproteobacteria bacterium]